jgi:cytochrome P450
LSPLRSVMVTHRTKKESRCSFCMRWQNEALNTSDIPYRCFRQCLRNTISARVHEVTLERRRMSGLPRRPRVQEVLQGRPVSLQDISRLPYTESVLLETLRVHPPAYMIGRCAGADTPLGETGFTVAKGTTVLVAPYLLHTNPDAWERPESFEPERWMRMREQGRMDGGWRGAVSGFGPNGSYLPFGGGPRKCIGTGFAMVEGMLVVASVLQRYRLEPPSSWADFPEAEPLITLRPKAVRVKLRARQSLRR